MPCELVIDFTKDWERPVSLIIIWRSWMRCHILPDVISCSHLTTHSVHKPLATSTFTTIWQFRWSTQNVQAFANAFLNIPDALSPYEKKNSIHEGGQKAYNMLKMNTSKQSCVVLAFKRAVRNQAIRLQLLGDAIPAGKAPLTEKSSKRLRRMHFPFLQCKFREIFSWPTPSLCRRGDEPPLFFACMWAAV